MKTANQPMFVTAWSLAIESRNVIIPILLLEDSTMC